MEPNVSTGFFDDFLKSLVKIGFDKSKLNTAKLKSGVTDIFDGLEPGISSPGNLDAVVLSAFKDMMHTAIDRLATPTPGPLVVGGKWRRSREEVEKIITDNGMQVSEFAPWILLLAQFIPLVIDLVKWLRSMKD